jgi:GTPase
MFATLDPKLRAIELAQPAQGAAVGHGGLHPQPAAHAGDQLPRHSEEVAQAEVLLHVRDAASTYGEEQKAQVEKVLGELDSLGKPRIEVLNKIDLLGEHEREGLASEPGRGRGGGLSAIPAREWMRC